MCTKKYYPPVSDARIHSSSWTICPSPGPNRAKKISYEQKTFTLRAWSPSPHCRLNWPFQETHPPLLIFQSACHIQHPKTAASYYRKLINLPKTRPRPIQCGKMLITTIGEVLTKFDDRNFALAGIVYMSSSDRGNRIGIAISNPFLYSQTRYLSLNYYKCMISIY